MQDLLNSIIEKKPLLEYYSSGLEGSFGRLLGYEKGELVTIASLDDINKTSFAIKSIIANIKLGKKILYFNFNEPKKNIIIKIISQMSDISIHEILFGLEKKFSLKYKLDFFF